MKIWIARPLQLDEETLIFNSKPSRVGFGGWWTSGGEAFPLKFHYGLKPGETAEATLIVKRKKK